MFRSSGETVCATGRAEARAIAGNHHEGTRITLRGPHGDSGKERRQFVELFASPAIERMIVALGALNLNPEKYTRNLRHGFFGLPHLRHDEGRTPVFANVPLGRNEVAGYFVPPTVLADGFGEVLLQGACRQKSTLLAATVHDHIAPVAGPVRGIPPISQKTLDGAASLIRGRIEHKRGNLGRCGRRSGDIERYTAEKGGI